VALTAGIGSLCGSAPGQLPAEPFPRVERRQRQISLPYSLVHQSAGHARWRRPPAFPALPPARTPPHRSRARSESVPPSGSAVACASAFSGARPQPTPERIASIQSQRLSGWPWSSARQRADVAVRSASCWLTSAPMSPTRVSLRQASPLPSERRRPARAHGGSAAAPPSGRCGSAVPHAQGSPIQGPGQGRGVIDRAR
jgi:hypothetical protein